MVQEDSSSGSPNGQGVAVVVKHKASACTWLAWGACPDCRFVSIILRASVPMEALRNSSACGHENGSPVMTSNKETKSMN